MSFFTIADPAAPTLKDRDDEWTPSARVLFAREAVRALAELHNAGEADDALVHRNLTPHTILVRYDNTPIFTGFDRTRIPSDVSVASSNVPDGNTETWTAPEVVGQGLSAADQRSDIYSLCVCLTGLFTGQTDAVSTAAIEILAAGQDSKPDARCKLAELERSLSELLGDSVAPTPAPPARFWTDDQIVRFHGRDYRIVSRLGSGGSGPLSKSSNWIALRRKSWALMWPRLCTTATPESEC
jgi:serine/threonine protein kinase